MLSSLEVPVEVDSENRSSGEVVGFPFIPTHSVKLGGEGLGEMIFDSDEEAVLSHIALHEIEEPFVGNIRRPAVRESMIDDTGQMSKISNGLFIIRSGLESLLGTKIPFSQRKQNREATDREIRIDGLPFGRPFRLSLVAEEEIVARRVMPRHGRTDFPMP